jgi:hypothetical protein
MFPSDTLMTVNQTQVRATNSRQPSSRSRAGRHARAGSWRSRSQLPDLVAAIMHR